MRFIICIPFVAGLLTSCQSYDTCYQPEEIIVDQSYVHRYGVEIPAEDWKSRGEDGKVVTVLKNGVIQSKNFIGGKLEGETTYTYPHSDIIERRELYINDNLAKTTFYYRAGAPKQELALNKEDGTSNAISWYENGTPQTQEILRGELLISGEYHSPSFLVESKVIDGTGSKTRRDQYGELVAVDTVQNGEIVLTTTYYPNGSPKEMTPFVHGIVQGQLKTFLPGGEPKAIEEWVMGQKTGITTLFENGEKFAEVPYTNGFKNGIEKRFRNQNRLAEEITWINDTQHGPHSTYIADITKTDWFFQGKPVTKTAYERMSSMRGS